MNLTTKIKVLLFSATLISLAGASISVRATEETTVVEIDTEANAQDTASSLWNKAKDAASSAWQTTKEKAPEVVDTIKEKAPEMKDAAVEKAGEIADTVKEKAPEVKDSVAEKAEELGAEFGEFRKNEQDAFIDWFDQQTGTKTYPDQPTPTTEETDASDLTLDDQSNQPAVSKKLATPSQTDSAVETPTGSKATMAATPNELDELDEPNSPTAEPETGTSQSDDKPNQPAGEELISMLFFSIAFCLIVIIFVSTVITCSSNRPK